MEVAVPNVMRDCKLDVMLRRLRSRLPVADTSFDEVYGCAHRLQSSSFWTPVAVALRAAELLTAGGATRILDVGSGVGKFCLVGAASSPALFVGVEQRAHLVTAAQEVSRRLGITSAIFAHATFDVVDITMFDGIYFFNPFEENVWPSEMQLDQTVELSFARMARELKHIRRWLGGAQPGTCVATYHGLGTAMPDDYERVVTMPIHSGRLELWKKTTSFARCG